MLATPQLSNLHSALLHQETEVTPAQPDAPDAPDLGLYSATGKHLIVSQPTRTPASPVCDREG